MIQTKSDGKDYLCNGQSLGQSSACNKGNNSELAVEPQKATGDVG